MAVLSKLVSGAPSLRGSGPAFFGVALAAFIIQAYKRRHGLGRLRTNVAFTKNPDKKKEDKSHVDGRFVKKLLRIFKILVPSVFSSEALYMVVIAVSLLCRTYADVWMITTSTKIEASIIDRNKALFRDSVIHYLLCMPTVSVVNALLKFSLSELKLKFRERLTNHLYKKYLDGFTFYKMSNLDNRIANADQLLTQDVDRFCEGIVELYSNLSKPLVDVALYVWRLGGALGFQAPSRLFFYLIISGIFLTYLRRPIGKLTVVEQQLEGEFRFVNSRLIMNSEEIAFYQGNEREKQSVMTAFQRMISHLRSMILFRFGIGFCDNIIAKYAATVVGWYTVSRPFFNKNNVQMMAKKKNELIQDYYNSGRMMFKLAEALGRLALAGREMTRLSGFTTRVDTLMTVLNDVQQGRYERTMVSDNSLMETMDLVPGSGQLVIKDNIIKFEDVPLVTPNGDILVKSLNFEVPSGRNVLICGPNGCGKSSLFRILGELWPLFGGRLTKPAKGKLFYVPQRPYMTLGTLRDQVIYPDKPVDMRRKGITDRDLIEFLDRVQLGNILQREGGWDSMQDWMDVLSGGEKQRIADFMAEVNADFALRRNFVVIRRGDEWRRIRHRIVPAFTSSRMKRVLPSVNECVAELEHFLDGLCELETEVLLKDTMSKLTMNVIGRTVLASKFNSFSDCTDDSMLVFAGKMFGVSMTDPVLWFAVLFPNICGIYHKLTGKLVFQNDVNEFFTETFTQILETRLNDPEADQKYNDVLQMLLAVTERDEEEMDVDSDLHTTAAPKDVSEKLSRIELLAQLVVFMVAGYETTATTLQFVLYVLSIHQEVQERAREECLRVLGNRTAVQFEDMAKLDYLNRVILETMRMLPPASRIDRECRKATTVNGVPFTPGMSFVAAIYHVHHNPDYFPEPDVFDPDRFLPEARQQRPPLAFMPFGAGPRICLGMRFAEFEMRVTLMRLLCRYRILPADNPPSWPLLLTNDIITKSRTELRCKLERI